MSSGDLPLVICAAGARQSLYAPQASGYHRRLLLDAVLGSAAYPEFKDVPGALERWSASDDFRAWELHLRPGLRFHNARPVTARDLEFTYSHVLLSAFETPDRAALSHVRGLRVLSDSTLQIKLARSDPHFLAGVCASSLAPVPREELHPSGSGLSGPSANSGSHLHWKRHPVGAGPYKIIRRSDDGAEIELEAARGLGRASPARIRLSTGEPAARVDLAVGFRRNPAPSRLRKVVLDKPAAIMGIYFDFAHPLARRLEFRRAVSLAIDPQALCSGTEDARRNDGIVPLRLLEWSAPAAAHDPRRAAALFKRVLAGRPRARFEIPIGGRFRNEPVPRWYGLLEGQLRGAGLPVRFAPRSGGPQGSSPFSVAGFIPDFADAGKAFEIFREGSGWVSRLDERDSLYERLLQKAGRARGPAREACLRALSERFAERKYAVPLFEEPLVFWVNPERVRSINQKYQGIRMVYQKIRMPQNSS